VHFVVGPVDGRGHPSDVASVADRDEVPYLGVTEERLDTRIPPRDAVGQQRDDEVRVAFVGCESGPPEADEFAASGAEGNDLYGPVGYGPRSVKRP
jgi:hypothetical protein